MILQLEHLAPYLPYKLKYVSPEHISTSILDIGKSETVEVMSPIAMISIIYRGLKPVMKPMNSLTQEELNSQGFDIPVDYFISKIVKAPFEMVQYLITQHYDIFGLLNEGLAENYYDVIKKHPEICQIS